MAELIALWDFNGRTDKSGNGHDLVGVMNNLSPMVMDRNYIAYAPSLTSFDNGITLLLEYISPNADGESNQAIFSLSKKAGGGLFVLYEGAQVQQHQVSWHDDSGFPFNLPSMSPNYLNKRKRVAVRIRKNSESSFDTLVKYANGATKSSISGVTQADLSDIQPLSFGGENPLTGAAGFFEGSMYRAELYDGDITDQEIETFFSNGILSDNVPVTDFLPLTEVTAGLVAPLGSTVSTNLGEGILNSNGSPVYVRSINISKGENKHIVNNNLSVHVTLSFDLLGKVILTEGENTTTANTEFDVLTLVQTNGQIALFDETLSMVLSSQLFEYTDAYLSVELLDGETIESVPKNVFLAKITTGIIHLLHPPTSLPTWANKETREQANPQPLEVVTIEDKASVALLGKSGNYKDLLDQRGNLRKTGYYTSTVLINKVPAINKRVFCFTNKGQLLDESISDANGVYRFDHLLLENKYMFVAQHSDLLFTPPDYAAVAADWQTPTPYKE